MIRLFRAFVEVADHRGFGLAAQSLAITQPALTKQIQALEREIGGPLFHRGRHGAALTELGARTLPHARTLVADADELIRRGRQMARGETGRLALGFGLSSIELAPRAVAAFRRRYPSVDVNLEDLPSTTQLDRVRDGELHAAFVRLPAGEGLSHRVLDHDHLAVASPAGQAVPDDLVKWLGSQRLVRLARAKGPGLTGQIDLLCATWRIAPGTQSETHDLQTVLALVAAGLGTALVPASAASIVPRTVRLTPIDDPAAAWDVAVVWSPTRVTTLTTNFLDVVQTELVER